MKAQNLPIATAFAAVCEYAVTSGAGRLNAQPGCWETKIDEQWSVAINGHEQPTETSEGVKLEFGQCLVTYNGWIAGIIDPAGGILCAGAEANEDTFIAACKAATERIKRKTNHER